MTARFRVHNLFIAVVMAAGLVFTTSQPVSVHAANPVRISQVYGGGGNSGSTYKNDFIELFNAGTTPVDMSGWSVQWTSAAGTTWKVTAIGGILQPGQYYLVQEAAGAGGTTPLPTPDAIGNSTMGAASGKIALTNSTTALSGACPAGLIDLVGYGVTTCFEGADHTPAPSNVYAVLRVGGGCTDSDNNAADFAAGLPTPRNTTSGFNFCAADNAPAISSTIPAGNATGVALNGNVIVNFSEAVDVADGWFSLSCAATGIHSAQVTGGPTSFILDPDVDFVGGEVCTVTLDNLLITDQDANDPPNEMVTGYGWSFTTTTCGMAYTPISAIQGSGPISPLNAAIISVEGLVTADFQGTTTGLNGFFIQSLPGMEDGDPLTSEGLMIYTNTLPANVGDVVRVQGKVTEYENLTELGNITSLATCSSGNSIPDPVTLDLPDMADPVFTLEPYEGMLVTFPEVLTVQQNYFEGRYGQVTLGAGGRIAQMNNLALGAGSLYEYTRMIILDDANSRQNANPIPYYAADDFMRAGDAVAGVTGIVDEGRINSSSGTTFPYRYYRLQPTNLPDFIRENPRPDDPPDVGGTLKVVGFNTLNYFTTLDMAPYRSTYPYGGTYETTPRGADTPVEFVRQQNKLLAALVALDADVYGLLEIESWDGANAGAGAAQALVDALNTNVGIPGKYAVVADPEHGFFNLGGDPYSDYIQTAIIYNTLKVTPIGASTSTDNIIFDRSPFAQLFEDITSGKQFVVVANHFKSKGCDGTETGLDMDQHDGQGCWNAKRMLQAQALLDFIHVDLIPLDPDVLVIGDLNSYGMEQPIQVLIEGGLINQIAAYVPAADRYSYVFDGTAGYLDHALSTPSFRHQIRNVAFWHINADELSVIDYNTEYKGGSYSPDLYLPHPYRSSDHDPVLIGLDLGGPGKPDKADHVGMVIDYQAGVSITILDDNGNAFTYLIAPDVEILPEGSIDLLGVGVYVTIIAARDVNPEFPVATSIVIHLGEHSPKN